MMKYAVKGVYEGRPVDMYDRKLESMFKEQWVGAGCFLGSPDERDHGWIFDNPHDPKLLTGWLLKLAFIQSVTIRKQDQ